MTSSYFVQIQQKIKHKKQNSLLVLGPEGVWTQAQSSWQRPLLAALFEPGACQCQTGRNPHRSRAAEEERQNKVTVVFIRVVFVCRLRPPWLRPLCCWRTEDEDRGKPSGLELTVTQLREEEQRVRRRRRRSKVDEQPLRCVFTGRSLT